VVVVLPASTWAMMPMLRMSAKGVVRGIAKFRLDSGGWVRESPNPGAFRGANGSEKCRRLHERVAASYEVKNLVAAHGVTSAVRW
jgi:hypothetical protein